MSYSSASPAKVDLYEQVTNSIIRAIEEGAGKYVMPWHSLANPINAASRKSYRGINTLLLWGAAQQVQYKSNEWATYKQWRDLGGQVRKGEKSTIIVFWKFFDRQDETEDGAGADESTESTGKKARCMARAYWLFNAAQVDGIESKSAEDLPESERIAQAEAFFNALPGTVRFDSEEAYYSKNEDAIHMPAFAKFKSASGFYSTQRTSAFTGVAHRPD